MNLALLTQLGVATGAISLVIAEGKIFAKPHDWLAPKFPFLDQLLSCSWCVSHWITAMLVLAYYKPIGGSFLDHIVQGFIVIAISQIVAGIMRKCIEH